MYTVYMLKSLDKLKVGAWMWIASVQFLIVQAYVAFQWPSGNGYSIDNTISDLGVTTCGEMFDRYICSPWHTWFNASLMIIGATMILGSILLYSHYKQAKVAFTMMAIGGFGSILVGLFPLGSNNVMHAIGAFLPFVVGNISMIVFAHRLDMPKWLKYYSLFAGNTSVIAAMLFVSGNYLWLGTGVIERVTAHLQTVWLITFGIYTLKKHSGFTS